MKHRILFVLAATVLLSGCTSIFGGGSSTPRMAYIGDLSNNRVARIGDTVAYAKSNSGTSTIAYVFKGVDGQGGIHINQVNRRNHPIENRSGIVKTMQNMVGNEQTPSKSLVFLPEQTLLVSAGVHVVFIRSTPNELHYRVVMTGA